jgi:hypothetical protein
MSDLIYIKNASGSGTGSATAANQTLQLAQETITATNTGGIVSNTGQTASYLNASGISAADYLKNILTTDTSIQSNTSAISSNTGARSVTVTMTSVTTNTTIAAGFSSYTFVNQGTQDATINTVLKLPVGSSFTVNFDRNETSASTFAIAFAVTTGANVCVITNS